MGHPDIVFTTITTPSGNPGYRVCAPSVPGLVVVHGNLQHALDLVTEAVKGAEKVTLPKNSC